MKINIDTLTIDELRNLLLGDYKDKALSLDDVKKCAKKVFGDPNMLCFYNLSPEEFFARDCKLLGRTAIEGNIDEHSKYIGDVLNNEVQKLSINREVSVIDLFLGSGNLLYHIAKATNATFAAGFELDQSVFECTRNNLEIINFKATIFNRDYREGLHMDFMENAVQIFVINPPWGNAFDFENGLDISKTSPPIPDIINELASLTIYKEKIVAIMLHEKTQSKSKQSLYDNYEILLDGKTTGTGEGTNMGLLVIRI